MTGHVLKANINYRNDSRWFPNFGEVRTVLLCVYTNDMYHRTCFPTLLTTIPMTMTGTLEILLVVHDQHFRDHTHTAENMPVIVIRVSSESRECRVLVAGMPVTGIKICYGIVFCLIEIVIHI